MLKLYVHPFSTPALAAEFTARATGTEFEKHVVDLGNGEQRSESYQAINPAGKVPALVDGDFKLSESLAIQRYLARRKKSDLYPEDIQDKSKVDQWMDYAAHHVRMPYGRIQFNKLLAPMIGQPSDEASIQMGLHFLSQNFPIIEAHLTQKEFLCGNALSLADITLLAAIDPTEILEIDISDYPYLTRWRQALRERDFYQNTHSHFGVEAGL